MERWTTIILAEEIPLLTNFINNIASSNNNNQICKKIKNKNTEKITKKDDVKI